MPFLLIFTIFALLDFAVLFSVGSEIGLLSTLALVLATGFIGLHLIRREGVATFARAQERMSRGEIPSSELMTGAALIFGGALLMAPGFLSDALGFMCLIPNARRLLGKALAKVGVRMKGFQMGGTHFGGTDFSANREGGFTGPRANAEGWDEASGRRREDTSWRESSAGEEQPLEGEFISKDERRR